ncbi:MAG: hypothetical protein JST00_38505 [Deltaproteobacteria bacterium]|nr:hypothetical protein [Deltaproteobacteria bacterium]
MRSPKPRVRKSPPLDAGDAFLPDTRRGPLHLADDEADALAEEFLASATSGEEIAEDARNELVPEELALDFIDAVDVVAARKEESS